MGVKEDGGDRLGLFTAGEDHRLAADGGEAQLLVEAPGGEVEVVVAGADVLHAPGVEQKADDGGQGLGGDAASPVRAGDAEAQGAARHAAYLRLLADLREVIHHDVAHDLALRAPLDGVKTLLPVQQPLKGAFHPRGVGVGRRAAHAAALRVHGVGRPVREVRLQHITDGQPLRLQIHTRSSSVIVAVFV